jgi:alpha-beta hydrolase superfamily lysophospholipase
LRRAVILSLLLASAGCAWRAPPSVKLAAPRLARAHFIASDGAVLPVRVWPPKQGAAKAVLIAVHGFNDYSKFFAAAGQYLSQRGILSYAYDQRGFGLAPGRGLWAGTQALVADLRDFAAAVKRLHPQVPLYLLGESMGGAEVILAATGQHPLAAAGLILSAPAVWGRSTMPWYQRLLLETAAHATPWMKLTGSGLKIQASDNIEMLRALGKDPWVIKATRVDAIYGLVDMMDAALERSAQLHVQTLVLYGERDEIVPREPIRQMLEKMQKPLLRTALYARGYHLLLRDLQAENTWQDILAWIENQNTPLPSGADCRRVGKAKPAKAIC